MKLFNPLLDGQGWDYVPSQPAGYAPDLCRTNILFCEEVPPWGGDTVWAAMGPVFESLSAGLQRTLIGLNAIHANVRKLGYS